MRISVVIPAYNEGASIGRVIAEIRGALGGVEGGYEIIVVDNNSTDNTSEIARKEGARVVFEGRQGYGRAYKTGLSEAQGDIIVTGDADCTYPFGEISRLAKRAMADENSFITANRFARLMEGSMPPVNLAGNYILTIVVRLLYGMRMSDSQSGMWVFRRDFLKRLDMDVMSNGMPFSQEMKICAVSFGLKLIEVPIEYRKRVGRAKLSPLKDGWDNLKNLFAFRTRLGSLKKTA